MIMYQLQTYTNQQLISILHNAYKVLLGVLRKNEQKEEDMIELLQWAHKYVLGHSKEEGPNVFPAKVLNGGDYLTHERHKSAQSSMQDARTPSAQLLGLLSKFEDFHAQCEWVKVIAT
jgi:hypothetical protein